MTDDLVSWLRGVLGEDEADYHSRVLADIAAKRAILDRYQQLSNDPTFNEPTTYGQSIAYEAAIALLASAYSDRPGYRPEWTPT